MSVRVYLEILAYEPTACRCGVTFVPKPGKLFHLFHCPRCVGNMDAQARRVNAPAARIAKREVPVRSDTLLLLEGK